MHLTDNPGDHLCPNKPRNTGSKIIPLGISGGGLKVYVRELQRLLSLEFFEDPDRTPLEYPLECQPNEIIAYNPHISRVQRMMPNRRPNSGRKANVGRRSSPVW